MADEQQTDETTPVDPNISVEEAAEAAERERQRVAEENLPMMKKLLRAIGLEGGARFANVFTTDGRAFENAVVEQVYVGQDDAGREVIVVFGESGLATKHIVRWAEITRLVR